MAWSKIHDKLLPHIVRIETQQGSGTGFLVGYNPSKSLAAIATAAHVVDHSHEWKQPIKLIHHESGDVAFLHDQNRAIWLDRSRDAATILVMADVLKLPDAAFPLIDSTKFRPVGYELGWMGFPSVAYPNLCFFKGTISSFLVGEDCYLIDGVAINGVSGGPVFFELKDDTPELVGIISAYLPNRTGNTPGLLRAQDITPFEEALKRMESLDEAKQKEREQDQESAVEGQSATAEESRNEG